MTLTYPERLASRFLKRKFAWLPFGIRHLFIMINHGPVAEALVSSGRVETKDTKK